MRVITIIILIFLGIENLKQILFNKEAPNYLLQNFDFESNVLLSDVPLFA